MYAESLARPAGPLRVRVWGALDRRCGQHAVGAGTAARGETEDRRRLHREDQGARPGSADLDRARRSSPGLRHRPHSAQVPQPRGRHTRRVDVREGHLPVLRGARQGVRSHHHVAHREDRGGARHGAACRRRRGDDQADRQVQGNDRLAHRSAKDDGSAGAAAPEDGQADLLDHQRHAFDRERRPRDAHRAAVPAGGRRDAVHSADPQQRDHAHHAGRSRSTAARSRSTPTTSTRSAAPPASSRRCR